MRASATRGSARMQLHVETIGLHGATHSTTGHEGGTQYANKQSLERQRQAELSATDYTATCCQTRTVYSRHRGNGIQGLVCCARH